MMRFLISSMLCCSPNRRSMPSFYRNHIAEISRTTCNGHEHQKANHPRYPMWQPVPETMSSPLLVSSPSLATAAFLCVRCSPSRRRSLGRPWPWLAIHGSGPVACAIGRRFSLIIRSCRVTLACGAASSPLQLALASSGLCSAPGPGPAWPIHVPRRASGPARSASEGSNANMLATRNLAATAEHSPAEPSHAPQIGRRRLR